MLFMVYQNVKTLFSKTNMPVYARKIFLENAIEMVSIILSNRASETQTFRNHHYLASSHRTQWKHPVFITESVSCIHVWRTPFSVQHKNESWTDGNPLSRKIQNAPVLSVRESVVTFHWCSVYILECKKYDRILISFNWVYMYLLGTIIAFE